MDQEPFSRTQPIPLPGRRLAAPLPKRPLYLLAGAIVLAGLFSAWWWDRATRPPPEHPETPAFEARLEPRLELLDGLRSFDSEDSIRGPLEAVGLEVQRRELSRPWSERYPTRQLVTLSVSNYQLLGVSGELNLEFFNDRLMEADFRPDDPASFAPRLHKALPGLERGRTGQAELVDGDLRVWSNVDLARSRVGGSLRTEALVLWQDLRLIRQRDDWDARFGHIPSPIADD